MLLRVVFTLILDSRSTLLVLFVSLSSLPVRETRFGIGTPFSALPPFCSILVPKSQSPCNGFHQWHITRLYITTLPGTTMLNLDACSKPLVFSTRIKFLESPLCLITSSQELAWYVVDFSLHLVQSIGARSSRFLASLLEYKRPLYIFYDNIREVLRTLSISTLSHCLLHYLMWECWVMFCSGG